MATDKRVAYVELGPIERVRSAQTVDGTDTHTSLSYDLRNGGSVNFRGMEGRLGKAFTELFCMEREIGEEPVAMLLGSQALLEEIVAAHGGDDGENTESEGADG